LPNSLTASGLTTATQAELLATLTTAYQSIYGATINLSSDTPDGQMMNIYVQAAQDILDLIAQVYNSFDPTNAMGVVLDQRVAINGIQRQGGTFSQVNVVVVTSTSVNLYGLDMPTQPTFTVSDNQGNQWELITSVLGSVGGTYLFQAMNPGAVVAAPNSLTIPVSIVIGVTSVNNPNGNINTGINSETDAVLKVRQQKASSLPSIGYNPSLTAALENINGISEAFVHENDSDGTDSFQVPGHSIWVIVNGSPSIALAMAYNSATTYSYGQIVSSAGVNYISVTNNNTGNSVSNTTFWNVYNPIGEAIYVYRNAGCGMYNSGGPGSNSYTVTQLDGTSFTVLWNSVQTEGVFIKFHAASLNYNTLGNPPNITGIINSLVANYNPGVYEELNINQLATLVQEEDPNTMVIINSGDGFSTSGFISGPYNNTALPSNLNFKFSITAANIIILPIILSCPGGTQTFSNGLVTGTNVSVASGGHTIQFTALGGHATYTYSIQSGAGSINSSTGLYTSAGAGTDVVLVTDSLSNTMTATVLVS